MRAYVGGGWHISHLSDRCVHLTKDDQTYRRLTGADGFVRCRAEPGMDRALMIQKALDEARKSDNELSLKVAADVLPHTREYRETLRKLAPAFATPEEPELIGVKRV